MDTEPNSKINPKLGPVHTFCDCDCEANVDVTNSQQYSHLGWALLNSLAHTRIAAKGES